MPDKHEVGGSSPLGPTKRGLGAERDEVPKTSLAREKLARAH